MLIRETVQFYWSKAKKLDRTVCNIIPPYANKVNCAFFWSKAKKLDRTV